MRVDQSGVLALGFVIVFFLSFPSNFNGHSGLRTTDLAQLRKLRSEEIKVQSQTAQLVAKPEPNPTFTAPRPGLQHSSRLLFTSLFRSFCFQVGDTELPTFCFVKQSIL